MNFVDWEFFLESNSSDILALYETNVDNSIDSGNFAVLAYLPLIVKDSSTHMHGLTVYVKEELPFVQDISRKLCRFLLMFRLALFHLLSYSISSNIDWVLSINPSANAFVFGDFNNHHKDWLTYSGGIDRSGELCYNFSVSNMTLLQWLTFLLASQTVDFFLPFTLEFVLH